MNKKFELKNIKNEFPLMKTLRFELKPQGDTLKNFMESIYDEDKDLYDSSFEAKKIMTKYYLKVLDEILSEISVDWKKLYNDLLNKEKKEIDELLQKEIEKKFKDYPGIKNIFSGKCIEDIKESPDFNEDEKRKVEKFDKKTTYFTAYFKNIKNIFTVNGKSASAIYRIADNFKKYSKNVELYEKLKKDEKIMKYLNENKFDEKTMDNLFDVSKYNSYLRQVDIEKYNTLLSGYSKENGEKVKGLNELINEVNQKYKSKLNVFNSLYKQILTDEDTKSFVDEILLTPESVIKTIDNFIDSIIMNDIEGLKEEFLKISLENFEGIYISNKKLNEISNRKFGDYNSINMMIKQSMNEKGILSKKEINELIPDLENINKPKVKSFNLSFIFENLTKEHKELIIDYIRENICNVIENVKITIEKYRNIDNKIEFKNNAEKVSKIKEMLESINELCKLIKEFNTDEIEKNNEFYNILNKNFEIFESSYKVLNKVRNFVTKKEVIENKMKLNFSNYQLGNGWHKNKEKDCSIILFRKRNNERWIYYLGILKHGTKIKENDYLSSVDTGFYKMDYYAQNSLSKMIPKCSITVKNVKNAPEDESVILNDSKKFNEPLEITPEIRKLYGNNEHIKGDKFKKESLVKWIDFCKEFLLKYKSFEKAKKEILKLKESNLYENLEEFYSDAEEKAYFLEFINIDEDKIKKLVKEKNLYLFQIYNKDFSAYSTGNKNLHTMYFEELFTDENLKKPVFKLNGNTEVFYRIASSKPKIVHNKGEKLVNKTYLDNGIRKTIPDSVYIEICEKVKNNEDYSKLLEENNIKNLEIKVATHEIVKDKRYFENKFLFYLPITLNKKTQNKNVNKNINKNIINEIKDCNEYNVIGIDRGERNLISLCIINQNGEIILQKEMNVIQSSDKYNVDYNEKLEIKSKERDNAKKNWSEIGKIKDLKSGYLSAVVHEIVKLAIEYNAVITLENLNGGFKNSRKKVDKQIYQKFERALIEKLNFLIFKNYDKNEKGGLRNAFQLTPEFKNNTKNPIWQQGIIIYTNPAYTSKIDPTTGYANIIKKSNNNEESIVKAIDKISYDKEKDMFYFDINLSKSSFNLTVKNVTKKEWRIYTNGERIIYKNKKYITLDITQEMKDILSKNGIDYLNIDNLKQDILENKIYKKVYYIFELANKMRNENKDVDYIISPVLNKDGKFFMTQESNELTPKDADLNGAYNIALKGKLMIDNLNKNGKFKFLSNEDWLKFIQGR